jgi:hypothetical protein
MDGGRRRVIHVRNWLLSGERTGCCVVWGADRDGVATADHLARTGTKILLISASHELAPDVGRRAKILTVPRLENDPGVRIVRNATLTEMDEHRVKVRTGQRERWIDAPGPLLLSRGLTPDTALLDVYRRHAPPRLGVFVAGAADGRGDSLRHSLASAAAWSGLWARRRMLVVAPADAGDDHLPSVQWGDTSRPPRERTVLFPWHTPPGIHNEPVRTFAAGAVP